MANLSETSDVSLEKMAQMLEDMDNLEEKAFNDLLKKSMPSSTSIYEDSNPQMNSEVKKTIVFKDKDEDDSLDGLLFEEESLPEKRKTVIERNVKSNLIEDLFKITGSSTPVISSKSENKFNSKSVTELTDSTQVLPQKQNNRSDFRNDYAAALHREQSLKKSPEQINIKYAGSSNDLPDMSDKSKKSSLINDLFDNTSRLTITDTTVHKASTKVEPEIWKHSGTESATTMQQTKAQVAGNTNKPAVRESRRGRKNSKIINDPLGLLSSDYLLDPGLGLRIEENIPIQDSSMQSTTEKNLPEWLGGTKKPEDPKPKEITKVPEQDNGSSNKNATSPTATIKAGLHVVKSPTKSIISHENHIHTTYPEHMTLLIGSQIDQQAAVMSMQQQEHELRTAKFLSQQNEQLSKVLAAQQSRCNKQEDQFTALLKMQIERQILLDKQLKAQQERIDNYIQTLMVQPIAMAQYANTKPENSTGAMNQEENVKILVRKLQSEVLELKNTLNTLNERHENEMEVQAESYRKQISFLQDALINLERRMRENTEFVEAHYIAKYEKLKDDKIKAEDVYREEINELKKRHAEHIEDVYKQQAQHIKLLQKENFDTLENISKIKQAENTAIETMSNYKADIETILQKADIIIENIKESQEKIQQRDDKVVKLREHYLKDQENEIKDQKRELEKQNNILQEHQNKLVGTTEKFDSRLTQLLSELQKQSAYSNQMQETLEKKATHLLKERELFEEKVKWERDYLQALKESWMQERERQIISLVQEKEVIAAERGQVEVLNRLKISNDEVSKIELETAIRTTQEVTASAYREKLRWQQKLSEVEIQQQHLRDKESSLTLRAMELENLTKSALAKKEEGMRALKDAKHLEDRHKEKLGELYVQLEALTQREKKTAMERFNRARNRLTHQMFETEKPERDTKVDTIHKCPNESILLTDVQPTSQSHSRFMEIIDPNLVTLKLSLEEQLDATHKYLQVFDS